MRIAAVVRVQTRDAALELAFRHFGFATRRDLL